MSYCQAWTFVYICSLLLCFSPTLSIVYHEARRHFSTLPVAVHVNIPASQLLFKQQYCPFIERLLTQTAVVIIPSSCLLPYILVIGKFMTVDNRSGDVAERTKLCVLDAT
jgi:hypothetical protein